jgi:serine/threonine protein kinase
MGTVYLANVEGVAGFEKLVALKVAHRHVSNDKQVMELFLGEARLSALLQHANLGQVYDLGQGGDLYFIAMEYIAGVDLRTLLSALRGARLPVPVVVAVICRLLEGLDYAHDLKDKNGKALKLVHRDVTPANCLISYTGDVKLIDFGIAKAVGQVTKTRTGHVRGKVEYMSPEQTRGEVVDRRSDVFSVGIVMYELLVGRRPFDADGALPTMENISLGRCKRPREWDAQIPAELEAITLKALATERSGRFQSAGQMQEELEQYLMGLKVRIGARELAAFLQAVVPQPVAPAVTEERTGDTNPAKTVIAPPPTSRDQQKTQIGPVPEPARKEESTTTEEVQRLPPMPEKTVTTEAPRKQPSMVPVLLGGLGALLAGALLVWGIRALLP